MTFHLNQISCEARCHPSHALRLATLFGALASAGSLFAQAATNVPPLTLSSAVAIAVGNNSQLVSLRAKVQAMKERPAQASALPNPMATYSGMDMADGGRWPDTREKRLMVQQEFPWFGKRDLRERIAAKDAEGAQRELEAATLDIAMRVKESFYDLSSVQRVIAITREEQDVIGRMVKIAQTQYATGSASQGDAIKAQTEVTLLKQKLWELQSQENTLKAKLNTLLNRRVDEPLAALEPPKDSGFAGDDAAPLFAEATKNRPEIQAAQTQIERYELQKKLMEKEFYPDYKLGVEYRGKESEEDMVMFTVSVELPFWQSKYRAGVREAEKLREASQADRETAERQSALDVQDAHFKLQTARHMLALYRTELIPQAQARFKASEAGYRTGKSDFWDLLESERFLLNAKTMAALTEGAVGAATARLERAVGADVAHTKND